MRDADRAATRRPGLASEGSPVLEDPSMVQRSWSLRTRLILIVALTSALVYAAITAPFRSIILLNVNREAEAMLREQARIAQSVLPRERGAMERTLAAMPLGVFSLQLIGSNGMARVKSGPLAGEVPIPKGLPELIRSRGGSIYEAAETASRQRIRVLTTWLDLSGAESEPLFLQLALTLEEKYRRLDATMGWFVVGGVLLIGLPAAAMWLFLNQWRRQFQDFCANARGLQLGNSLHSRLMAARSDPDLGELARVFNGLIERVEKTHTAQQRFIADASHEMRTPLTIIRGEIDVILRRDRDAAEYREVIESNREEIEKLSRLVDNMLMLALADAGEGRAGAREVDLAATVQSACKRLQTLAAGQGVELQCSATASSTVLGDAADLERALLNLIENALHFSTRGEVVSVTLNTTDAEAIVSVTDRGPGIAAEDVPRIFDRFYRADKARSRAHGGAGLGLAIVKTIVEAHGGVAEAQSQPGLGSTFRVRIPLRPKPTGGR